MDHPTNPCAVIYSDKTLKQIVNIAGEHDLPIVADEMYQLVTYDGHKAKSVASFGGDVPVVILSSMSKFFMKPGWCFGFGAFYDPEDKIKEFKEAVIRLANLQGYPTSRIPTPIFVAAAKTYSDDEGIEECFSKIRGLHKNLDFTYKRLNEIDGVSLQVKPQCALYALFRIDEIGQKNSRWPTDLEFVLDVLRDQGLSFFPGSMFGPSAKGYTRTLLYRNLDVLEEAYNRLEEFMKKRN
jgi:aspartate/methionine/tyrosine aminotransferase